MRIAEYKNGILIYRDATTEEVAEVERQVTEEEARRRAEPATDLEKIEAQTMYTALMTDTLLEEE